MSLTPGRFAGQVRDARSTTSQRGMPSTTVAGIGGTGFSPLHLPGLALWLDAADTSTITASSGAVSQWNDKSGYGRNVSQATAASQPGTGAQTQNGLNVLTFDGGDWLATASAAVIPQPFMVFAVAWHTTGASNLSTRIVCNVDDLNGQLINGVFFSQAALWYGGANYAADALAGTYAGSTFQALGASADGSQSFAMANNVAGTRVQSGTSSFRAARIGARFDQVPFGLIGRIAEVVIYGRTLTLGERAALQNYFASKWAL